MKKSSTTTRHGQQGTVTPASKRNGREQKRAGRGKAMGRHNETTGWRWCMSSEKTSRRGVEKLLRSAQSCCCCCCCCCCCGGGGGGEEKRAAAAAQGDGGEGMRHHVDCGIPRCSWGTVERGGSNFGAIHTSESGAEARRGESRSTGVLSGAVAQGWVVKVTRPRKAKMKKQE